MPGEARLTKTPGPAPCLFRRRERFGDGRTATGACGAGWRINKPKDMRGQEVVAPS